MKTSQNGINLIKQVEGLKRKQYLCPAGLPSIGYGHLLHKGERYNHLPDGITDHYATTLLKHDIKTAEECINKRVKVPLSQNQYDALVSLVYNVGCKQFSESKALKALNEAKYLLAATEFFSEERGFVNIKRKKCKGLINRRNAEYNLWLSEKIECEKYEISPLILSI